MFLHRNNELIIYRRLKCRKLFRSLPNCRAPYSPKRYRINARNDLNPSRKRRSFLSFRGL